MKQWLVEDEDGKQTWVVPAGVAEGLYDAAKKALASMPIAGESESQDEARWAIMAALAAADGEGL